MALQALSNTMANGINNTATLLNMSIDYVDRGAKGWLRNSDGIWITSAVVYYAALLENQYNLVGVRTSSEVDLAKVVALGCSIFAAAIGIFRNGEHKNEGADKVVAIPHPPYTRLFSLAFTNAAAITLYVAQRLELKVTPVQAFVATTVPYFVTTMALDAYFREAPVAT